MRRGGTHGSERGDFEILRGWVGLEIIDSHAPGLKTRTGIVVSHLGNLSEGKVMQD